MANAIPLNKYENWSRSMHKKLYSQIVLTINAKPKKAEVRAEQLKFDTKGQH